jgi:hypothetical protein
MRLYYCMSCIMGICKQLSMLTLQTGKPLQCYVSIVLLQTKEMDFEV